MSGPRRPQSVARGLALAAAALTLLHSTAGRDAPPPRAAPPAGAAARAGSPAEPWIELPSNDGTYLVRYRTSPPEIELGVDFDVEAEVLLAGSRERAAGAVLRIDGDMPEHGHGLMRLPPTLPLEGGRFRAEGLRFFMPGHWELYLDVTRGAVTERAQAGVLID